MGKYKKNFLKGVIVRADFVNYLTEFDQMIPNKINKVALSQFPIAEPQEQVGLRA